MLVLLAASAPAAAQRRHTPNTLAFDSFQPPPAATLAAVAWLAGHWRGPAPGGTSEEVWTQPEGGSMMGMYRLLRDERMVFYEILSLQPQGRSVAMMLKHFHADLRGWEEKDEVRSFPLVRLTPTEAWFDGMTLRRVHPDRLLVHVAIRMPDGTVREEELRYQRVTPALR